MGGNRPVRIDLSEKEGSEKAFRKGEQLLVLEDGLDTCSGHGPRPEF